MSWMFMMGSLATGCVLFAIPAAIIVKRIQRIELLRLRFEYLECRAALMRNSNDIPTRIRLEEIGLRRVDLERRVARRSRLFTTETLRADLTTGLRSTVRA